MVNRERLWRIPSQLLGRAFGAETLERIQRQVQSARAGSRAEVARRVCQELGWVNRGGSLALMSARVALLKLHRAGLIGLPPPRNRNGNGRRYQPDQALVEPDPIRCALSDLQPLRCQWVAGREPSRLWNSLIERYHYLGHENLPGAQVRYLLYGQGGHLLGAAGFGAAAWKVAARDQWIGWNVSQRRRGLDLVLNNARFLMGPWLRVPNLAGHALEQCVRQVAGDFAQRYGWRPVLLESFVERRFEGHCYRTANWICLGPTRGRGKKGIHGGCEQSLLPFKQVWVYPLRADFRKELCAPEHPGDV